MSKNRGCIFSWYTVQILIVVPEVLLLTGYIIPHLR
ncbi:hypothetical protein OROMI_023941 [Orobanche minor]